MVTTSLHEAIEYIFTGQYKNERIFLYLIELFFIMYYILPIFLKIYFSTLLTKYINESNKIIIKLGK